MQAPIISFRNATSPYGLLTTPFVFSKTVLKQSGLPTLAGTTSDTFTFRIYNNYSTPPTNGIATAYNITLTTYDGASSISHTASTAPVSQMWLYLQENGFGEQSSVNGLYYHFQDDPVAVGGSISVKIPSYGSDSSVSAQVRAGTNNNGVGFIEISAYASVPSGQSTNTWNAGLSMFYDWNS